jgi:hypothetical protein
MVMDGEGNMYVSYYSAPDTLSHVKKIDTTTAGSLWQSMIDPPASSDPVKLAIDYGATTPSGLMYSLATSGGELVSKKNARGLADGWANFWPTGVIT